MLEKKETIINLASKEYSKCIETYIEPEQKYITCVFGEIVDGKITQKGTYAKMARGEMVRFMAENNIQDIEQIKGFKRLGYRFLEAESTEDRFVFVKESEEDK